MQVNFTNPELVSLYTDLDHLQIKILKPEFFISLENGLSLDGYSTFRVPIRP